MKSGPSTRKAAHPFTNDDPAGRACFDCHGGAATSFSFAGTVYANAAGTARAANVEVRMLDKGGKALSAWTNADGNFFFPEVLAGPFTVQLSVLTSSGFPLYGSKSGTLGPDQLPDYKPRKK